MQNSEVIENEDSENFCQEAEDKIIETEQPDGEIKKVKKTDRLVVTSERRKLTYTQFIVYSALLSAIGILIPMVIPKIIIVPEVMTVTPASHVAVMLAMFISPWSAAAVTLTTAIGFLISTTPTVAIRALSHIFFAIAGSYLAKFMLKKFWSVIALNCITAVIHAVAETFAVFLCIYAFGIASVPVNQNVFFYLFVLVGAVTVAHSVFDFILAYGIYLPLRKVRLL